MKKFFTKFLILLVGASVIFGIVFYMYSTMDFLKTFYTVNFDSSGGVCEITSVEVEKNSTIELPVASREGYNFDGWYFGDEKWLTDTKVKSDMTLVAKWIPKKFDITFIVEGEEYVQACDYDSIPIFNGTPQKTPTTTIEYVFTGWEPALELVSGEATYTAKFRAQERKYKILATTNYPDAGVITGTGGFSYLTSTTVSVVENTGYTFIGWFRDDELYSSSKTISFENIDEDISLVAKFDIITKTITYISDVNAENPNLTTYDIRDGLIDIKDLYAVGYIFNGWFTGEDGAGIEIVQIGADALLDYTLYADWDLIVYTISYDLNSGVNAPENPSEYTIETETFTLGDPTRTDFEFMGWEGSGLKQITATVVIEKGTYGDLEFIAVWVGDAIIFSVDGMFLFDDEIYEDVGDPITAPSIDGSRYGMDGYIVKSWYTDEDCINEYTFTTMPSRGLTLYGRWEYKLGEGFYPYLSKFRSATTDSVLTINSHAEMVAWFEYILFYDITTKYEVMAAYSVSGNSLKSEIETVINESSFERNCVVQYTYLQGTKKGAVWVSESRRSTEASLMYSGYNNYTYEQDEYLSLQAVPNTRPANYEGFKINNIKKELEVSTTHQLVYVLEKGLKPKLVPGSSAERIYNKAKQILRSIVDDDMNNIEKLRAIYEWIVLNVAYDNLAYDKWPASDGYKYKCFYAEGVFDYGVAVCDGFADALLIMAKIENIPTITVSGNNHEWNKVMIDGKWYGIDATHGNLLSHSEKKEYFSYNSFMFTDEYKRNEGYSTQEYKNVKATTVFNIYDYITIPDTDLDLLANSDDEVCQIIEAILKYASTKREFAVELSVSHTINLGALLIKIERKLGVDVSDYALLGNNLMGHKSYSFTITRQAA